MYGICLRHSKLRIREKSSLLYLQSSVGGTAFGSAHTDFQAACLQKLKFGSVCFPDSEQLNVDSLQFIP